MQMRFKTWAVVSPRWRARDHRVRRLRRVRVGDLRRPGQGHHDHVGARHAEGLHGPLADAYNKTHKAQVKVSIIPSAQFVQKFGTAAASGNAPDVASIDLVFLPYFASQGALEDISSSSRRACPTRTT